MTPPSAVVALRFTHESPPAHRRQLSMCAPKPYYHGFRCGLLGKAAGLYTEALHAARALRGGEALLGNLLCNRALCHLRLRTAEAALADATEALEAAPTLAKAHYRAAQALQALGRMAEAVRVHVEFAMDVSCDPSAGGCGLVCLGFSKRVRS